MKAFVIAVVVAIALAVGAAIGLSLVQETVAQAYSTESVRLDQQENVNDYGRELGRHLGADAADDPAASLRLGKSCLVGTGCIEGR